MSISMSQGEGHILSGATLLDFMVAYTSQLQAS